MSTKFSQLGAASSVDGTELAAIVQGGTTKRTTLQIIADWVVKTAASFTQSGTGAVAETMQAMGRRLVFAAQYDTLAHALTAASGGKLIINSAITVSTDTTINVGTHVEIWKGGSFAVSSGKTLTVQGPLTAGIYQIFSGAGLVVFSNSETNSVLYPEWWGAVRDQSTDDGPAFNALFTAAPAGFVCQGSPGAYAISTALATGDKLGTIRGASMQGTSLDWRGGASTMLTIGTGGSSEAVALEEISLDNHGTATWLLRVRGVRKVVRRVYCRPTIAPSSGCLETDEAVTSYHNSFQDCYIASISETQTIPVGIYLARGHTLSATRCHISGCVTGIKVGGAGGEAVIGYRQVDCHIESGSGAAGYPGGATAIGTDLVQANAPSIRGCTYQMDQDGAAGAAGQRAIKLQTVNGGYIHGYFDGAGQCTGAINIASASALKVKIDDGCQYHNFSGYGVVVSGAGVLSNCIIGSGVLTGSTTGAFNNTFTPVFTSLTLGAPSTVTHSGTWQRVGNRIDWNVTVVPSGGTTTAATAVTYMTSTALAAPAQKSNCTVTDNSASDAANIGVGLSDTDGRTYMPKWTARTDSIQIRGSYPVA